MKTKFFFSICSFILLNSLISCKQSPRTFTPSACNGAISGPQTLSISSDGKYVIASHVSASGNGIIILWNLSKKNYRILSCDGNPFSTYFIKNTNYFMWQDTDNFVYIDDINLNRILSFKLSFPVYGHVMTSDLQHYFAADKYWSIHSGFGVNEKILKDGGEYDRVNVFNKPLDLTLSSDNKLLLSTGANFDHYNYYKEHLESAAAKNTQLDGITLWDTATGKLLHTFTGNKNIIYAALSPDSHYLVSEDSNGNHFTWDTRTYKLLKSSSPIQLNEIDYEARSECPLQFIDNNGNYEISHPTFPIKFIDNHGDYLRFIPSKKIWEGSPKAELNNIQKRNPIKYIDMSPKHFFPSHFWNKKYVRNKEFTHRPYFNDLREAYHFLFNGGIDTSPSANILVTAQLNNGINVYHYDPVMQNLTLLWSPSL